MAQEVWRKQSGACLLTGVAGSPGKEKPIRLPANIRLGMSWESILDRGKGRETNMVIPQLLNDVIRVLMLLAPAAALVSLVLAGISLRREGGTTFLIGGSFTKWMFWSAIFATLGPLISWFTSFGVAVPMPAGGIATSWLSSFQADISSFVTNFIVGRLATTLSAYFVLRSILDAASGNHPLPSVLTAMFLLGIQTSYSLIQNYNTGTQFATVDVLDGLWTYLASTIMPIAAGLAIVGAVINVVTRRPAMRLIAVALGMLCVSGIWRLVLSMEA